MGGGLFGRQAVRLQHGHWGSGSTAKTSTCIAMTGGHGSTGPGGPVPVGQRPTMPGWRRLSFTKRSDAYDRGFASPGRTAQIARDDAALLPLAGCDDLHQCILKSDPDDYVSGLADYPEAASHVHRPDRPVELRRLLLRGLTSIASPTNPIPATTAPSAVTITRHVRDPGYRGNDVVLDGLGHVEQDPACAIWARLQCGPT